MLSLLIMMTLNVRMMQAFVKLTFVKHPIQSLRPQELNLRVAPIDIAFVEDLVCKVALFLAEGVSLLGKEYLILKTLSIRSLVEEIVIETNRQGRAKYQPAPTQELILQVRSHGIDNIQRLCISIVSWSKLFKVGRYCLAQNFSSAHQDDTRFGNLSADVGSKL